MNYRITVLLCVSTFFAGILMFAFQYEWLILRIPQTSTPFPHQKIKTKQPIKLHYWHEQRWSTETQELIWSTNIIENLHTLVSSWLSTIDAEQIVPKKITLQAVTLLTNKQDAYLSFDRNLFPKEWSTFHKWMLIEGLLKTIRENNVPVKRVSFLVHHQPLRDPHLDFTNPWPLTGFLALK